MASRGSPPSVNSSNNDSGDYASQLPKAPERTANSFPVITSAADTGTPLTSSDAISTASGRKRKLNNASSRGVANLSPEQLAKKRANDRQAQRAIRERTKAHVEALEQQVRELSSQRIFVDMQAALRQNETLRAENRELRLGLSKVMNTLQPLIMKDGHAATAAVTTATAVPTTAAAVAPDHQTMPIHSLSPLAEGRRGWPAAEDQSYTESGSGVATPTSVHSAPSAASSYRENQGVMRSLSSSSSSFRTAFDHQRHILAHGLDFGSEERLGFNFLLNGTQNFQRVGGIRGSSYPGQNDLPPLLHQPAPKPTSLSLTGLPSSAYTAPIRNIPPTCTLDAILLDFLHNRQTQAAQGVSKQRLVGPPYPSVSSLLNPERSASSHPVSKVFTDILRTFPDIASLPEQVAVLYMMFILMRWQIYPTQENYDRLPDWLTPCPSQLLTPHPAWIDYLPWPRMRDHLVMSFHDYPFENWFIPFTRTLSVNWPYEATDCLLSTGESDDLVINPVFERHFRNLGNWSLGPAFAESFPRLVETTKIRRD